MKIFNTKHIENTSNDILKKIHSNIDRLAKDKILKEDLNDIKLKIFKEVELEALNFNIDKKQLSSRLFELTEIEIKRFSQGIDYSPGVKYLKYFFEMTLEGGSQELLFTCPSEYIPIEIKGSIVKNKIIIEFQTIFQKIGEIEGDKELVLKNRFKETFDKLEEGKLAINEDVKKINLEYEELILDLLKKKKKKIEDDDDFNNSLNNF